MPAREYDAKLDRFGRMVRLETGDVDALVVQQRHPRGAASRLNLSSTWGASVPTNARVAIVMGTDSFFTGTRGEYLAMAFLSDFFTGDAVKPIPDVEGIDYLGHLRDLPEGPAVAFQVKAVKTDPLRVERNTIRSWLDKIEHEPVVVLFVVIESLNRQEYFFRVFHDWLLENPGCGRQRSVTVSRGRSVRVDPEGNRPNAIAWQ